MVAGVGRQILNLVERECRTAHGFGRVVLWTDDQVGFYEACGYHRCRPLHTVSKAVSRLDATGLSAIEAMLARQRCKAAEASAASGAGGVLEVADACDGGRGTSSVWLSKRLLEHYETAFAAKEGGGRSAVTNQAHSLQSFPSAIFSVSRQCAFQKRFGLCPH